MYNNEYNIQVFLNVTSFGGFFSERVLWAIFWTSENCCILIQLKNLSDNIFCWFWLGLALVWVFFYLQVALALFYFLPFPLNVYKLNCNMSVNSHSAGKFSKFIQILTYVNKNSFSYRRLYYYIYLISESIITKNKTYYDFSYPSKLHFKQNPPALCLSPTQVWEGL